VSDPSSQSPNTQPSSTRIVAGQSATPKRPLGLKIGIAVGILALIGGGAAVASAVNSGGPAAVQEAAPAANAAAELKLGYFGNVTHAPALVGVSQGYIAEELGATSLSTQVFNAGPAAIEALNAGAIDATYIGPNPAINSFVKSGGESVNIIAGAAAGGAQLVVKPEISSAADLKGKPLPPRSSAARRTSPCAPGSRPRATRPTWTAAGTWLSTPPRTPRP
jgi:NitT/TauT family transport system substrate-binding protein